MVILNSGRFFLLFLLLVGCATAQEVPKYFSNPQNLQVLPSDISPDDLQIKMRDIALGLGVRCETCHVGDRNKPMGTGFDFASDDKRLKRQARLMLEMVNDINGEYVPLLNEIEPSDRVSVRCVTCHRGRLRPKLIQDEVEQTMLADGIDKAIERYRRLKKRFYGRHSYDFGETTLPMYAQRLTKDGEYVAEAIKLVRLNIESFPESYYSHFVLAELLGKDGQIASAVEMYNEAGKLSSNSSTAATIERRIKALEDSQNDE